MSFLSQFLHALLYPLSVSFGIIHRIFQFLTTWSTTPRRHLPGDPASVADRWVRELEEETGAIRESRLADTMGVSTGTEAQAGPGPSTLSRRNENTRAFRKHIPEFYLGSYEAALREAQRDYRVLCVILVSEEHDDVLQFKQTSLVDIEFNETLRKSNFLVWGGDVRDYEASQASHKLGATTYPFIAFIGLQPKGGSRNSSSSTSGILTVLSRHQGPPYPDSAHLPSSEHGPTSARALVDYVNNTLLVRHQPFLDRLRALQEERIEQTRVIEAQNAAYALAAQRDTERIQARIAEERRQKEEFEMQERKRAAEERERKRIAEEKAQKEHNRLQWYRYARKTLLTPEPKAASPKDVVRVGVRLPDGKRVIRQFSPSDSITSLYVFAASQLIPTNLPASEDPSSPPSGFAPGEAGVAEDCWSFKLATAFPRQEIPWRTDTFLSTVQALQGGAQLVVESIPGHALIPGSTQANHGDDSDYDTEDEE